EGPARPAPLQTTTRAEVPRLDTDVLATATEPAPTVGGRLDPRPEALAGIERTAPETFRLAALPATPTAPAAAMPDALSYPGSAITTPLGAGDGLTPDAPATTDIAALPEQPVEEAPAVAAIPEAEDEAPAAEAQAALPASPAGEADETELAETDAPAEAEPQSPALDTADAQEAEPSTPGIAAVEAPEAEPLDPALDTAEAPAPQVEEDTATPGLTPTELALTLTDDFPPRARPQDLSERIERLRYGGLTLSELADRNPPDRPASDQVAALLELASRNASELAVETSAAPRDKPDNFDNIVATALVQREAEQREAALAAATPDTTAAIEAALAEELEDEAATAPQNSPRLAIPSTASVARQATLEDAIRLNRLNLIGVYGAPSDRRALVRLSSGRYVKVKVGDRVDGGTVSAISASQLQYRKGSRTLSLTVPEG
ncbi:MAG: hypothetical protein AAF762_14970, partial [Pseudomonadota bacterium]